MYMANAKVLRLVPNATYIPLTRVGGFASPNARDTNMLVFFALGNAKVLSFALGDAKVPNGNGFASQWNIGLKHIQIIGEAWSGTIFLCLLEILKYFKSNQKQIMYDQLPFINGSHF